MSRLVRDRFPGVFLTILSGSEIKPVEPGQGNACEGRFIIYHAEIIEAYLSQQHFPLIFLINEI